jgi:hypothetical protein
MRFLLVGAVLLLAGFLAGPNFGFLPLARAADAAYKLEALKEGPPEGVSEKLKEVLPAEGFRLVDKAGQPFLDVWLRKSLPTVEPKAEQGVKFGQLEEGSLLGVIRFHKPSSDFKGNAFPAGAYTFRNGIQPRDGDHLGVSDSRDFVLLSPFKVDTKLEAMSTKDLIKMSVQVSGIKHPTVLYLMKMSGEAPKLPRLVEDSDLSYWILDGQVESSGKDKAPVRLGIVLIGKAAER